MHLVLPTGTFPLRSKFKVNLLLRNCLLGTFCKHLNILVGKSKIFYVPTVNAFASGNFKLGMELENEMDEHYWKLDLVENGRQLLNEIPILGHSFHISVSELGKRFLTPWHIFQSWTDVSPLAWPPFLRLRGFSTTFNFVRSVSALNFAIQSNQKLYSK